MRQGNSQIMTNVSLAADVASDWVLMDQQYMCAITAVWTGTPTGNFTIETSNDVGKYNPQTGQVTGITNIDTYTSSTQAAGGASGKFTWRLAPFPDRWVRIFYDASSGTGTVNARINLKG